MRFDKRGLIGKRGLSDVVTTGLIILLAIAAVVIVWSFVRPAITDVGEKISGECLTVDVEPVSCTSGGRAVSVRNGPGETTVSSVRLVFYNSAETSSTVETPSGCTSIAPLATALCTLTSTPSPNNKVAVAAVINNRVCPESTTKIDCAP